MAPGNYAVLRRIGGSGTNDVLLAAQYGLAGLVKLVVLKSLRPQMLAAPDYAEAFAAEARRVASIDHPNIATTYDVHQDQSSLTIAMEYLSGEDVGYLIGLVQGGHLRLPTGVASRIVAKAAAGLHHAHASPTAIGGEPLVHGDLSPGHILVCYSGAVKLINFGLSKADPQDAYALPGTLTDRLAYRSPERIRHRAYDHRSDVYSLGVVLYELLSGRRVFGADTEASMVKQVMEQPVDPPSRWNPEVPKALDEIVLAAIRRDPDKRTQTAHQLQQALGSFIGQDVQARATDIAGWMNTAMSSRYAERQQIEREAGIEAMAGGNYTGEGSRTGVSGSGYRLEASLSASGASRRSHSGSADPSARRARALLYLLLASVGALMFVSLFGLAYWLGRGSVPDAGPSADGSAALWVRVAPPGARLSVDGRLQAESVDSAGVLVPTEPSAQLSLAASKEGYITRTLVVTAPARDTKEIHISLAALSATSEVVPEVAAEAGKPPPKPAAVPEAPPAVVAAESSDAAGGGATQLLPLFILPLLGLLLGGGLGGMIIFLRMRARLRATDRAAIPQEAGSQDSEAVPALVTQIEHLNVRITQEEARREQLQAENDRLRLHDKSGVGSTAAKQTTPSRAAAGGQQDAARLTKDLQKVRQEAEKWRDNATREQNQRRDATKRFEQAQAELKQAHSKLQQSKTELDKARQEASRLRAAPPSTAKPANELDKALAEVRSELQEVKSTLDSSKRALTKAKTDAGKAKAELEGAKVQLKKAESKLPKPSERKDRAAGDAGLERLRADLKAREVELDKARHEMAALQRRVEESEAREQASAEGDGDAPGREAMTVGDALEEDPNLNWKQRETIRMLYQGFTKSKN